MGSILKFLLLRYNIPMIHVIEVILLISCVTHGNSEYESLTCFRIFDILRDTLGQCFVKTYYFLFINIQQKIKATCIFLQHSN